jgi:integrase/recombinase XerD
MNWTIKKNPSDHSHPSHDSLQCTPELLQSVMEQFLLESDITENSKKTYFKGLKKFTTWLTQTPLNDNTLHIGKKTIISYKNFLASTNLTPHTQAIYLVSIKQFFRWTESTMIFPNIARNIKGIKKITKQHHKDPLSKKQIHALLQPHPKQSQKKKESIILQRNMIIIKILLFSGMRIGELTKIKLNDIEYPDNKPHAIIWIQGKGRAGKDSFVIVMNEIIIEIKQYIAMRTTSGETINPDTFLFISHGRKSKNQPLTSDGISKIINKEMTIRKIKNKKNSAHSLRHTFGVNAIESGVSLYDLQIAMRHSTPNTTQVYLGDIEKTKRKQGSTETAIFKYITEQSKES